MRGPVVHEMGRFHGQIIENLPFVHENRAFRGQRDGIDEVVHEMGWFYGEGTRSEEGRRVEGGRQNVAQGERERGVGLRGKDF